MTIHVLELRITKSLIALAMDRKTSNERVLVMSGEMRVEMETGDVSTKVPVGTDRRSRHPTFPAIWSLHFETFEMISWLLLGARPLQVMLRDEPRLLEPHSS